MVFSQFTACLQTHLNRGEITWSLMSYCLMIFYFKNRCILRLLFCALKVGQMFEFYIYYN